MVTLPLVYDQMDARWANLLLGTNTDYRFNIYNYGCLLCDLTTVARYYGKTVDPIEVNAWLRDNSGFAGGGNYIWGSLTRLFGDITEKLVNTPDPNAVSTDQINEIKNALDSGYPVICRLDYNPKTVAPEFHYVILVGYNPADENDFTIADPLGGKIHSLKDYLGWFRPNARATIQQYCIMTGLKPALNQNSVLIPIQVNEDNVHGSTQWDSVVSYFQLGDPKHVQFEPSVKDILDTLKRDQGNLAIATSNIAVAIQQKLDLQNEFTTQKQTYEQEIELLKKDQPDILALRKSYQDQLTAKDEKYQALLTDWTKLYNTNKQLEGQSVPLQPGQVSDIKGGSGLFSTILNYFLLFCNEYAKLK